MSWEAIATTFVTLTVITDPIGIAPIFIAATARSSARLPDTPLRGPFWPRAVS